jgi:hypothetical protein
MTEQKYQSNAFLVTFEKTVQIFIFTQLLRGTKIDWNASQQELFISMTQFIA